MLSAEVFKQGIEDLLLMFGSRGFKLTEKEIEAWYKYCSDLSDYKFTKKIEACIKKCTRNPYLADVLNAEIEVGERQLDDLGREMPINPVYLELMEQLRRQNGGE